MDLIATILFLPLIILSLLGKRWAYITTIVLGILFFFLRVRFHLNPTACQVTFDVPLAIHSLTNYKHIILFAVFFIMTKRQINQKGYTGFGWAALVTIIFGLVIELLEGLTGEGNCSMRDLVPDFAGVLLGQVIYISGIYLKLLVKKKR